MTNIFPFGPWASLVSVDSSESADYASGVVAIARGPNDPAFVGDVTIRGAVVGSRWWMADDSDHSKVLSTGVIASDPEVVPSVPSYSSGMVILLRLRKASSAPYYKPFEAKQPHSSTGITFYVAQELDQ